MGMAAGDLLLVRTMVNSFMPSTATNSRTSVTCDCRVEDAKSHQHLEGLPRDLSPEKWRIIMPDGQNVEMGDTLTVPGKGDYTVVTVHAPQDFSTDTTVDTVLFADLFIHSDVVFKSSQTDKTLTASVLLFDASRDLTLHDDSPGYQWGVLFDNRLRYPANTAGDTPAIVFEDGINAPTITATALNGTRKTAISRPRPHPLVPISIAYFNERP